MEGCLYYRVVLGLEVEDNLVSSVSKLYVSFSTVTNNGAPGTHNCLRVENSLAVGIANLNVVDGGRCAGGQEKADNGEGSGEKHLYQRNRMNVKL